jgi:hypothetical protein
MTRRVETKDSFIAGDEIAVRTNFFRVPLFAISACQADGRSPNGLSRSHDYVRDEYVGKLTIVRNLVVPVLLRSSYPPSYR